MSKNARHATARFVPAFLIAEIVAMVLLASQSACAVEFVVVSSIFVADEDQPVAKNVTYFLDDRVVDTSLDNSGKVQSAVVLKLADDGLSDRIELLDEKRSAVCFLTTDELLQTVAAVTSRLDDKPEIVRFAAASEFDVEWTHDDQQELSDSPRRLIMAADPMTYRAKCQLETNPGAARRYQRFADMSARLNVTHPGGLPPGARMEVNRELANKSMVPVRVELTRTDRPVASYSKHEYRTTLNEDDRSRIARIEKWAEDFEPTDLVSFRLGKATASRIPANRSSRR